MDNKEKLIFSLKIIRAVIAAIIDVIEVELNTKTERDINETSWFEKNSQDNPYNY